MGEGGRRMGEGRTRGMVGMGSWGYGDKEDGRGWGWTRV